jgi:hypothetical protein
MEQKLDPIKYYEHFLRRIHPEYDETAIQNKLESANMDEPFRELLELMQLFELEIERHHSDWDIDKW